jgi:UDP-N-acetylmuramate dehydrogenase
MSWQTGLDTIIDDRVPLGPHTYYRLGGPARWFARPRTVDELAEVVRRTVEEGIDVRPLGAGANVLVNDDGVDGVVMRLDRGELGRTTFRDSTLVAGAGANMMRVVVEAARRGLGGLSCMAGIPGTIGGCLRGNAGGRVTVLDAAGKSRVLEREEIEFDYRRSSLHDELIVSAEFALEKGEVDNRRRRLREIWNYKKGTQPLAARSCGCVFKNARQAPAGALIERAGLKGFARGRAQVSLRHANFIIAHEGATASDVRALIDHVRDRVSREFHVDLELEIEMW